MATTCAIELMPPAGLSPAAAELWRSLVDELLLFMTSRSELKDCGTRSFERGWPRRTPRLEAFRRALTN
jgi:hypothetical protein